MTRYIHFRFQLAVLLLSVSCAAASTPPADHSSELAAALQQRSETAVYAGRVARLAAGGQYLEAEKILSDLVQTRPLGADGRRVLETVYFRLSTLEQLRVWNRWCSSRPASHFPFLVRGMYFLERARFLDGANRSVLLSTQQRRDFNHYVVNGRADLEKAAELSDVDPGPPAALTELSIHLRLPRLEMEKWFQRAVDIDPGWLASYRAKLLYLSPWRYGSEQMMEQFARECFNLDFTAPTTYIVALDYLKLRVDRVGPGLQGEQFLLAPENYSMLTTALDRYLTDFPLSPAANIYVGLNHTALSQPYVAAAAFDAALDRDPDDIESRKGRALAYLDNRQFREAGRDLVYLEQLQGETGFSRFHLGVIAFNADQDVGRAHLLIDEAIALERSSFRRKNYYYQRAEFYRQRGRQSEAIADYSAAIQEDVLFEEAYFGRAQARHGLGDLEGGLADLVLIKSTIKGRMSPKARSLINVYLRKPVAGTVTSKADEAGTNDLASSRPVPEPQRDMGTGLDNDYREFLIRGLRLYYEDRIQESRRDFFRVISYQPDNAKAYYMLGEIAARHDFNQVEACLFFKEAYRLSPETPDYLIELSGCLQRQGRFSDAITLLSSLIDNPDPPEIGDSMLARIYFLRGSCLENSGLLPEALEDMRQALALDPGHEAAAEFIKNQPSGTGKEPQTDPPTSSL